MNHKVLYFVKVYYGNGDFDFYRYQSKEQVKVIRQTVKDLNRALRSNSYPKYCTLKVRRQPKLV